MSAFTVQMEDRPGELARLCAAMAAREINIVLSAIGRGGSGWVAFVVDDESGARTALGDAGIEFTERPALTLRMENVPGAGAESFRRLAEAGVNVDVLLPVQVSGRSSSRWSAWTTCRRRGPRSLSRSSASSRSGHRKRRPGGGHRGAQPQDARPHGRDQAAAGAMRSPSSSRGCRRSLETLISTPRKTSISAASACGAVATTRAAPSCRATHPPPVRASAYRG